MNPDTLPSEIKVLIVGKHPHQDKVGVVRSVDGKVGSITILGGPPMFLVEFEDGECCYAEMRNLKRIK